jgi:rare lipoprotein A
MRRRGGDQRGMGQGKSKTLARVSRAGLLTVGCLALAHCSSSDKFARKVDPRYGVSSSPRMVGYGEPVPRGGGVYRIGKPYVVAGQTYVPQEDPNYRAEGLASWYGDDFHGRQTANGEVFDMDSLSAAHPTLPMPSYARVTNLQNHRSVIVRINDRGPYHPNRVIDVSHKAAELLGFRGNGVARVRVEYVGPASIDGADERMLLATYRQGEPAPPPSSIMLASAKPFVPQLNAAPAVLRGGIPVPADRPFSLGQPEEAAASPSRTAANAAAPRSRTAANASFGLRWQGDQAATTAALQPRSLNEQARAARDPAAATMSAYAPASPDGSPRGQSMSQSSGLGFY